MKKSISLFLFSVFISAGAAAQVKLYEDRFNGGVTGGSFSSGVAGTSSGVITIHIDPASTIRKAYLIAGRLGPAPAMTVNLNAMVLTFDASNQATPAFITSLYGGASAVHAIDITSQVNPAVNTYNISYTQGGSGTNFFTDFYLYVAYENLSMPLVNTVIFLKTLDFAALEPYTLTVVNPIDTLVPVAFAMHAGYMCDSSSDGENIYVASVLLGDIGGGDSNNPPSICAGTSGTFFYENNTLAGIGGDSEDQPMHGQDALSDVRNLLPNTTTTFDVLFEHFGGGGSSPDNSMWAWIMAYGNSTVQPLALFASPNHICPGTCTDFTNNSVNATSYQWFFNGANPAVSTDVNPLMICYNAPGQYDVMLIATNSNGSDTLLLLNYITVYPYPAPQGIAQSGDTLFANPGAVTYQWYHGGNLIPGATNNFYVAPESGNYNVVATDGNGCEVEAAIFDVVAEVQAAGDRGSLQLEIYPNPVRYELYVNQFSLSGTAMEISIYNVLGEKIYSDPDFRLLTARPGEAVVWQIDCGHFTTGIYFLEITSGDKIVTGKFIKQ